jgi:hypothetical protein
MYAVKTRTGSVYLQLEKRGGTRTRALSSQEASRARTVHSRPGKRPDV